MTPGDPRTTPLGDLEAALVDARAARGGGTASAVLVGPADDPLAIAAVGERGRLVAAPGAGARLLVGAGVAAAGAPALVLVDAGALPPRAAGGGLTAVARDLDAAVALHRAGWTLAQPVWAFDVAPLLDAAFAAPEPVVLRLHGEALTAPDPPVDPPAGDVPRVLARGTAGVVVAAGPAVAAVVGALPGLRGHGLELALVDAHTRSGHAPRTVPAGTTVLVGGPEAAADLAAGALRLGALRAVELPPGADPVEVLAERVPLRG